MAARLLARSKTLALTLTRSPINPPPSPFDSVTSCSQALRFLRSLTSVARSRPSDSKSTAYSSPAISSILGWPKQNLGYEKTLSRWFCDQAQGQHISQAYQPPEKKAIIKDATRLESEEIATSKSDVTEKEVLCFSPLEAVSARLDGGLKKESLKLRRFELSQKITFALIPALILISKSSLTTSLLIFSVYWQIYGFFKEIFLDYIHHEVSRAWVLVYFKLLLLILAKDTILLFGLA